MRLLKIILFFFSIVTLAQNKLVTPYETGNGNQTTTYEQCIAFYQKLDAAFPTIQMIEKGKTDSGKPLHLVLFSADLFGRNTNKTVILLSTARYSSPSELVELTQTMMLCDFGYWKSESSKNVLFTLFSV